MGAGTLLSGERALTHRESVGAPYPTLAVQIRDDDRNVLAGGEVGVAVSDRAARVEGAQGPCREYLPAPGNSE
jgi:hypothetical protein